MEATEQGSEQGLQVGSPVLWCKAAGERARLEDPTRRPSQEDGSARSIIGDFRIKGEPFGEPQVAFV